MENTSKRHYHALAKTFISSYVTTVKTDPFHISLPSTLLVWETKEHNKYMMHNTQKIHLLAYTNTATMYKLRPYYPVMSPQQTQNHLKPPSPLRMYVKLSITVTTLT